MSDTEANKPWNDKEVLEGLFKQPSITSDTVAATYLTAQGYTVSRRTIADARQKFGIPAASKKSIVLPDMDWEDDDMDIEQVWEKLIEMQEIMAHTRRDKPDVHFTVATDEPVAIAFIGDIHMGDVGTDHKQLLKDVDTIKNTENLFLVCGGDYINNFIKTNRNYNPYEVVQPRMQWRLVEWFFKELEDSIAVVATGNHDAWTEELTQYDGLYAIVKNLNFAYAKHGGNLHLHLPGHTYKIRFKHNTRGGAGANPTASVKTMLRMDEDADVGALFDTHVPAVEEFIHEGLWRVAIRSGTYKTNDHWAKQMGFDGDAKVAVPVVVFHPRKRFFMIAHNLEQGTHLLEWARDAYSRGEFGS